MRNSPTCFARSLNASAISSSVIESSRELRYAIRLSSPRAASITTMAMLHRSALSRSICTVIPEKVSVPSSVVPFSHFISKFLNASFRPLLTFP